MAIVVDVSNVAHGPLGLSYESVYEQLFNSEHPESEPCEDRKISRSFKTLNRHIAVSSFKNELNLRSLKFHLSNNNCYFTGKRLPIYNILWS